MVYFSEIIVLLIILVGLILGIYYAVKFSNKKHPSHTGKSAGERPFI